MAVQLRYSTLNDEEWAVIELHASRLKVGQRVRIRLNDTCESQGVSSFDVHASETDGATGMIDRINEFCFHEYGVKFDRLVFLDASKEWVWGGEFAALELELLD
jgi:hypothetical protein